MGDGAHLVLSRFWRKQDAIGANGVKQPFLTHLVVDDKGSTAHGQTASRIAPYYVVSSTQMMLVMVRPPAISFGCICEVARSLTMAMTHRPLFSATFTFLLHGLSDSFTTESNNGASIYPPRSGSRRCSALSPG
jgi:hypothetical protein